MHCASLVHKLDGHFKSRAQQRTSTARTIVHYHPDMGFGDEMGGFLGAMTIAVATNRRLEIAPLLHSSYLSVGFLSPFDFEYTGDPWMLSVVPVAVDGFQSMLDNCIRPPPFNRSSICTKAFCCIGKSHYVPRPLDFMRGSRTLDNFPRERVLDAARTRANQTADESTNDGSTSAASVENLINALGVTTGHMNGNPQHRELIDLVMRRNAAEHWNRRVEVVTGLADGGVGSSLFRSYFRRWLTVNGKHSGLAENEAFNCAVRYLLRPSPEAVAAREILRPNFWPVLAASPLAVPAHTLLVSPSLALESQPQALSAVAARARRPRIGIHVRAMAALFDRAHRSDAARYHHNNVGANAPDAELCDFATVRNGPNGSSAVTSAIRTELFEAYWAAARQAEDAVLTTLAARQRASRPSTTRETSDTTGAYNISDWSSGSSSIDHAAIHAAIANVTSGAASAVGTSNTNGSARHSGGGDTARRLPGKTLLPGHWLLITDSLALKRSVKALWPRGSGTTDIKPSHPRCSALAAAATTSHDGAPNEARDGAEKRTPANAPSPRTQQLLETVAEVLLLSEADAIVHGQSRYASLALMLCTSCVADMRVVLDTTRCGATRKDELCMGEGRLYRAVNELDAEARRIEPIYF